ncbi:MAG: glycogen-binding domain-containing protein [Gemmatimonadota bacterium]|nr:glycogen-binding domain-containing protein [Gemmatimonadota bacterium]
MRPEIQAYLDGEVEIEDLPLELRERARAWQHTLAELDADTGTATAPEWLEEAVMAEVALDAQHARRAPAEGKIGIIGWLTRPRNVRVSPLAGGLAAAAVAALMVLPLMRPGGATDVADATIYVQFVMEAPSARTVAVAGDFNDWGGEHELSDPDGDGIWTGRVAVQPGIHEYMFVIDGAEWVTPPGAEGYRDDGFGSKNAVVTVLPTA